MKTVTQFGSEIAEIASSANKAKTLLRILDEDFIIMDTANPSEVEKASYSKSCGEIYVFLEFIGDCINKITENISALMQEV